MTAIVLDVVARDRVSAIVLASGTTVIVARAAGTGTTGTTTAKATHAMAVGVGVTGIVDGTAPMTEAAVARAGGTTTATGTHTMTATSLGVVARVLAHGIASDTTMGWRALSAMSPRTPAGAAAVAAGDRERRDTTSS